MPLLETTEKQRLDLRHRRDLILKAAVQEGLLQREGDLLAAFIDLDGVDENIAHLRDSFPSDIRTLHAFAAKANCLVPVLSHLEDRGMGCEVASEGELAQALEAGFQADQIVFDSPAKTFRELRQSLSLGTTVNADNFQELDRIKMILAESPSASPVGIRINPQVGVGGIEAMSTAGGTSKFGISLEDEGNRERLVEAFRNNSWLNRVHAHVGSQGCPLSLIARGIAQIVDFADEVNQLLGRRQITGIDIGGGLPVDFQSDSPVSDFEGYVAELRASVPRLFSGEYLIITEFGRSILAKYGFIAAFVEYTKTSGGRAIAITHAGAQVATRTAMMPESWPIRIGTYDADGDPKTGPAVEQDVAGPCCFAGDLVARNRPLPLLQPGDIVSLLDTGAYYFSTHFSYNSLPAPAVYGVTIDSQDKVTFRVLRHAETIPELLLRSGVNEAAEPTSTQEPT